MSQMSFLVNSRLFRLLAYSGIPHTGCPFSSHIYNYYQYCYTHEIAHAASMNDKLSSWDREI
jgi:hypothetical protein